MSHYFLFHPTQAIIGVLHTTHVFHYSQLPAPDYLNFVILICVYTSDEPAPTACPNPSSAARLQ